MKKYIVLLTLLTMVISESYAALHRIPHSDSPEKPGYCHFQDKSGDEEISFYLKPGQIRKHPIRCARITCYLNEFTLIVDSCATYRVDGFCEIIPGDNSKPFPSCCAELIC